MPDDALIDRLDQAIDALLAGVSTPVDPEIAALTEIAATLRLMPDEGFQNRLKSDLQRRATMPTSIMTIAPARSGLRTVTPLIAVAKAPELIAFLKQAFDAAETSREAHGEGSVSALRIGDSDVLVMSYESSQGDQRVGAFHLFVPDCDATFHRAIKAGATSMGEPEDRPYGERSGFVKDLSGNYWYIGTPLGGRTEIPGTVTPYLHPMKARPFIDFLKRAFGAQELALHEGGGRVMHASVRIGDTVVEMGEPQEQDSMSCGFYLTVEDCDAAYQRAIEAGAKSLWPPTDQRYGDRTAGLADPFGYQWYPATRIKE